MRTWLIVCLMVGSAATALADSPAPETSQQAYQTAIDRAVQEFDLGHYAEARASFHEAHALSPSARTLRGLAKTEFELRNYRECIGYLEQALASEVRPLRGSLRRDAIALLERAEGYVARYHLELSPPDARVRVDGELVTVAADAPLVLEVGDHVLQVQARDHEDARRQLRVQAGGEHTLRVELRPLPGVAGADATTDDSGSFWTSPWTWTAVGVVAVAVTTTLLLTAEGGRRTVQPDPSDIPEWQPMGAPLQARW